MYGFLIACGMALGIYLATLNEKRLGLPKETALDFALLAIPLALIGARLYYVAFQWGHYQDNILSIFYVWEGGMAIYGGVIGGIVAGMLLSKKKKIPFLTFADMVMPSLLLGQAIGRWGNFFNQEAYGNLIENPALQFFPYGVLVEGAWYQATFFYESLWNFLGFLVLWFTRKKQKAGDAFFLYFILYGSGRFWIEGLRSDSLMLGTLRVSQGLSLLMVVASVIVLILRHQKHKTTH